MVVLAVDWMHVWSFDCGGLGIVCEWRRWFTMRNVLLALFYQYGGPACTKDDNLMAVCGVFQ